MCWLRELELSSARAIPTIPSGRPFACLVLNGGAVNKTLGIVLIVLGVIGLAWGGFAYTTREKIVDIGPIHASRDQTHNVPLPPIVGAVALIGGIVCLMAGKKT
jgi:hypothetical protein